MEEGRLSSIRWVSVFLLDEEGMEEFRRKDLIGVQKIKRREKVKCICMLPLLLV